MTIRAFDFSMADYEAVAKIWNTTYPDYPGTPEEVKKEDELRPEKIKWRRYVLVHDGQPIGFGVFLNSQGAFHPQEFWVTHVVLPVYHGRGFGKALDLHLMQGLEPFNPTKLYGFSREDLPRKTRFLQDRGYRETMRSFESRLNLDTFDSSPYTGFEEQMLARGIRLTSYAALANDPQREQKIYDLHTTLDQEVPMVGTYTKPSFETFAKWHWLDDAFLPDAYMLAVAGDSYVGLSELFRSKADKRIRTGLTGVHRDYRKQGVAFALKLAGIEVVRKMGYGEISTWNESNNRGMLGINERLGFKKEPATIDFVKEMPTHG